MKIQLLDMEDFVQKNKIKQVKSIRFEGKGGKPDAEGLFSEEIFGRIGSQQRRTTFGYIDLNVKIIHPEAWEIVVGLGPEISKLVTGKRRYTLGSNGELIEDESGFNGFTGIKGLVDNWDNINLSIVGRNKPENVKFLKSNRNLIFIEKTLVLPAGIRDIQLSKMTGRKMMTSSEINSLYQELITQTKTIAKETLEFMPDDIVMSVTGAIQRKVNEINDWIRQRLKGKGGIIRGGMLSKTVDYSGRFAIVGDPSLKLGYIGLPWQAVLKLFEPFTEHFLLKNGLNKHVLDLIRENINKDTTPDSSDIKRFLSTINEHPDSVSALLKDELVRIAEEIVAEKVVLYKRDPVENRDSYMSGFIRVDRDGFVMKINPLDAPRCGADFVSTC